MRALVLLVLVLTPALALAQQPDVATLQRAVAVMQQQRNQAMDALASIELQRLQLVDEIERLKAEIARLKKPE